MSFKKSTLRRQGATTSRGSFRQIVVASSHRTFENIADGAVPQAGDVAPGFDLRRSFEESVSLGDLNSHGPVLLLFYVFDFGHV